MQSDILNELLLNYIPPNTKTIDSFIESDLLIYTLQYLFEPCKSIHTRELVLDNFSSKNDLTIANVCMVLDDYEKANEFMQKYKATKNITTKLSGRTAKLKFFNNIENDFLVLEVSDLNQNKKIPFETDKLKFIDYEISPLNIEIQYLLLSELNYIMHTEKDDSYKEKIIRCYVDRMKHSKNISNDAVLRYLLYFESYICSKSYYEFSNIIEKTTTISCDDITSLPFIKFESFKFRLGYILMKEYLYPQALTIFNEIKDYENIIKCYVGLNKENEAITELMNKIIPFENGIVSVKDLKIEKIYELQQSYLLLASFTNNIENYDKAYDLLNSAEPYRLKGLYYYRNNDYENAVATFEKALKITRLHAILFSYGCSLIKINQYEKALRVFKEIALLEPQNDKIQINISNCYLHLKEYRKSMLILEKALMHNHSPVFIDLFFSVCIEHGLEDIMVRFLSKLKYNKDLYNKYEHFIIKKHV